LIPWLLALCIPSSDYAFFEREKMGLCIFTLDMY
jgi:hypothetical protein